MSPHSTTDRHIAWTQRGLPKIVTSGHRKSSHCRRLLQDDRNVSSDCHPCNSHETLHPRGGRRAAHPTALLSHATHPARCHLAPARGAPRHSVRCPHFSHAYCSPTSPSIQLRDSSSSPQEVSPLTNPLKTKFPVAPPSRTWSALPTSRMSKIAITQTPTSPPRDSGDSKSQ